MPKTLLQKHAQQQQQQQQQQQAMQLSLLKGCQSEHQDGLHSKAQPPPPPPLQPCPALSGSAKSLDLVQPTDTSAPCEPIDYSMKRQQRSRSPSRSRSRSPQQIITLLPRPRHANNFVVATGASYTPIHQQQLLQLGNPVDPLMLDKAALAADVIRLKLEGHGRRIHTFLGVILHCNLEKESKSELGFSAGPDFSQVAVFCDQRRSPQDRPSNYFLVLNTQMLALIWCKFKGNSSAEFSTLTRAIRSCRQKYSGIFESVGTPCKKLYKFGDIAMSEFRAIFPHCYAD